MIMLIVTIPVVVVSGKSGVKRQNLKKKQAKSRRILEYLEEVVRNKEYKEERYAFKYEDTISETWKNRYDALNKEEFRFDLVRCIYAKIGGMFGATVFMILIGYLFYSYKATVLSGGAFLALVQRLVSFIDLLSNDTGNAVYNLIIDRQYIKDIINLWMLDEENEEGLEVKTFKELEFKNVSFKYPKSDNYVLKDMSFIIKANTSYSFVGANAAGKTTIVKLILGLYLDYKGTILLNGIDIRKYSRKAIRQLLSVMFQDFARYELSVQDNVFCGGSEDTRLLWEVMEEAEISQRVKKLPRCEKTYLGKLYNEAVDFSGGEWQKLALARNLYKNHAQIQILDEPTSAIDPLYEEKFFGNFKKISKGKAVILISHRLGSTRFTDHIYVIENGHIEESGDFDSLIARKGIYYEMFEKQKKWYN